MWYWVWKTNPENVHYCHEVQKFALVKFPFKKEEYFLILEQISENPHGEVV